MASITRPNSSAATSKLTTDAENTMSLDHLKSIMPLSVNHKY